MKTLILFIQIIFILNNSEAQVSQLWERTFNGPGNNNDETAAIVYDGQGNIIITGSIFNTGNNRDFCTIKYNSAGVQQWASIYSGTPNLADNAVDVDVDNTGNVYVTGYSLVSEYDIVLVKYNSAGVQQWVRLYNGPAGLDEEVSDLDVDDNGNIYLTGFTESTISNSNFITLKYNTAGDLLWAKEYNNPINSSDYAYYVKADNFGNAFVTGSSIAQGTGSDFLTIKYSANGDSSWIRRYSGTTGTNELPQGIAVDNAGSVIVTGFSRPSASIDYVTIKYSSAGVQQWIAIYDSTQGQDIPEDVETDNFGNVYVTGRTRINSSYNDFGTIKYNSSGIRQWIAVYNNPENSYDDYGYDMTVDDSGNVYVVGFTNVDGSNYDVLTIKYNTSGSEVWKIAYEGNDDSECYAITLDDDNNVYVTGYAILTNSDYLTIKYAQTVGINQISTEVPEGFSLKQNYPNPFNPVTKIKFEIPDYTIINLTVFDQLGKQIQTLINGSLSAGTYETDFNAEHLSGGVYFYRLNAGNFSEVRKMILIK